MIAYIIRRLLQLVIVLFGVTLITFGMLKLVPGDPARRCWPARAPRPRRSPTCVTSAASTGPFYVQYVKYVERLVHGDLGESLYSGAPGRRDDPRGGARSRSSSPSPRCSSSCSASRSASTRRCASTRSGTRRSPRWRSSSGASRCSCSATSPCTSSASSSNWLPHRRRRAQRAGHHPVQLGRASPTLILPALTLGLIEVAYISYMQRASMLEVIRSDFIRTARAKGLSERKVIWGHGFKNAVIPVMTIAGIDLGALIGGAIITETVFNRPGIGLMIYQAIGAARHRRSSPAACCSPRSSSSSPTCSSTSATRGSTRASGWRTDVPDWDRTQAPEDSETLRFGLGHRGRPASTRARTAEVVEEIVEEQAKPLGLWADTWRRLKRNKLALVGLGIIIVFLIVGTVETVFYQAHWHVRASDEATASDAAGYLAPYDPNDGQLRRCRRRVSARRRPGRTRSAPTSSAATCFSRDAGRDPRRHARRHHRRGHRPHARPAPGAGLGLLRRRGRLRHHARRRHLLRVPVHPVRAAHHERARAGVPERLHRHRRARLGDLRARRARPDPQREVHGVRRGGARPGRRRPAHHLPPRAAEQHGAGLRGRRHGHRRRHRHRGGPELPRHRHPAARTRPGAS